MKKFLAILLSLVMLFTLGVTAFADDADAEEAFDPTSDYLPADPTLTEGKIILDVDNMYFEPSETYSVPIRIYADALDALDAIVEENGSAEVEDLYFTAGGFLLDTDAVTYESAETVNVRVDVDAPIDVLHCGWNDDYQDYIFVFKINKDNLETMLNTPEEGIIIGYVDIEVKENFGLDESGNVKYGEEITGVSPTYMATIAEFDDDLAELGASCNVGYVDANGDFYEILWEGGSDDLFTYDRGNFYHSPRVLTWKERLTLWAVEQGKAFLNFFSVINDVLMSLLNGVEIF